MFAARRRLYLTKGLSFELNICEISSIWSVLQNYWMESHFLDENVFELLLQFYPITISDQLYVYVQTSDTQRNNFQIANCKFIHKCETSHDKFGGERLWIRYDMNSMNW